MCVLETLTLQQVVENPVETASAATVILVGATLGYVLWIGLRKLVRMKGRPAIFPFFFCLIGGFCGFVTILPPAEKPLKDFFAWSMNEYDYATVIANDRVLTRILSDYPELSQPLIRHIENGPGRKSHKAAMVEIEKFRERALREFQAEYLTRSRGEDLLDLFRQEVSLLAIWAEQRPQSCFESRNVVPAEIRDRINTAIINADMEKPVYDREAARDVQQRSLRSVTTRYGELGAEFLRGVRIPQDRSEHVLYCDTFRAYYQGLLNAEEAESITALRALFDRTPIVQEPVEVDAPVEKQVNELDASDAEPEIVPEEAEVPPSEAPETESSAEG